MLRIWKTTFTSIGRHALFYLITAVLLEAVPLFSPGRSHLGALLFVQFGFLYILHRHFLLGEAPMAVWAPAKGVKRPGRWAFFGLSVGYFIALLALSIGLVAKASPGGLGGPNAIPWLLLAALVGNWIGLSVFGTAFPACALGERFGLALTLRRARSTALGLSGRLLLGPGLFGLIAMAAAIALINHFGISAGLEPDDFTKAFTPMLIVSGATGIALTMIGLTTSALAVATLCDAYRRVQPAGVPAVEPVAG